MVSQGVYIVKCLYFQSRIASLSAKVNLIKKSLDDETDVKNNKEQDGSKFVKEARADLQKICRVLLLKKLENEDLKAEV